MSDEITTPQSGAAHPAEAAAAAMAAQMRTGAGAGYEPDHLGAIATEETFHSSLPGAASAYVPQPRRRLGDIVVDAGWATREQVETAVVSARQLGRPIGQVLYDQGAIDAEQLGQAVADRFGLPYIPLRQASLQVEAATLIDAAAARRLRAMPIAFDDETLVVAMTDPGNIVALDDIAMMTGQRVRPVVVSDEELDFAIQRMLGVDSELTAVMEQIDDTSPLDEVDVREATEDDSPAVKIVQSVIAQAVERHASDVHFDPSAEGLVVRFRIDGVIQDVTTVPQQLAASVVSRIKILAELNIAERRLPQDGRVGFQVEGRRVDLRVVSVPLVNGESIVLRVLDSGGTVRSLDELGMRDAARERLEKALRKSHGGILATGPTGSGKTTTIYGALQLVHTGDRSIFTIEDPVEYRVPGIKQLQINPKIGLEFANGLRTIVRADPDVILVGEIRDVDSARIAMQSAITGHLVLSTLHTNDAATAISRLVDMGVPAFMVVSAVSCVVGQRLARRLCDHCKVETTVSAKLLDGDTDEQVSVYEPQGCARCGDTGYNGRVGLYEVLLVSDEIRRLAIEHAGAEEIERAAVAEGMVTFRSDAIYRVREGTTSMNELARVATV
jgi:type IV pilus assembly protein PilB